jgi:small subunit ribosomal protein S10
MEQTGVMQHELLQGKLTYVAGPTARCQALVVRAATAVAEQKIQIKLKAYTADLLQESVALISDAASSTGARVSGPVYLPTR